MLKPPEPPLHDAAALEMRESPFKGKTGLIRIVHAFFNSVSGLEDAWRNESAFRQEILLAIFLIPIACVASVTAVERAVLIGAVGRLIRPRAPQEGRDDLVLAHVRNTRDQRSLRFQPAPQLSQQHQRFPEFAERLANDGVEFQAWNFGRDCTTNHSDGCTLLFVGIGYLQCP